MQSDAGVALLTRALASRHADRAHAPGIRTAQDGPPEPGSESGFGALLASALIRAPDMAFDAGRMRAGEEPMSFSAEAGAYGAGANAELAESSPYPAPEAAAPGQASERPSRAKEGGEEAGKIQPREEEARTEEPQTEEARPDELQAKGAALVREGVQGKEKPEQAGQAEQAEPVRRALDAVRKGIRELVQEGANEEKQKKLAGDLRGLLDLLSLYMPVKKLEALEKEAARAIAAAETGVPKKGIEARQGAVQDKGVASLVRLAKLLPDAEEAAAFLEKAKAQLGEAPQGNLRGNRHGAKKGEAAELARDGVHERDAREVFRFAVELRDQRVNDPRSLRDAVRVIRHEGLKDPQGKQAENALPVANAAETQAVIPVSAPKAGQQSSLFAQHDFGAAGTGASKKAQAGEGLKNPQQIVKQIVEHARVTVKSGMTEMHLTLTPRSMGRIGMHFTLGADGELSAKLVASNESVRQYLQDNLSNFSRDLADAGVSVTHLEVMADGSRNQFMNGRAFGGEAEGGAKAGGIAETGTAQQNGVQSLQEGAHDGRLDVRA